MDVVSGNVWLTLAEKPIPELKTFLTLRKVAENTKQKINTLVDEGILEDYKLALFNEFLNSL